jgi:beta-glucosidase
MAAGSSEPLSWSRGAAQTKKQKIVLIGLDAVVPYTGGSGSGAVSNASAVSPLVALKALGLDVSFELGATTEAAAAAAKAADVAIVFGSAHTGEGHDRKTLNLEANIDELIPAVCPFPAAAAGRAF